MKVELFYAPGCTKCTATKADLEAAAEMAATGVEWCEINVLDSLDRAVELGVLTLPALAIDGQLVFTTLPTPTQLATELRHRRGVQGHGA
ncbi:glutaredoxin family protein [Pseudogulbenkiania subflava]|uniref:Thioredoxin domain-containing protein n=1 Tax=Pseudogulbenkiania subflava DSM 22618 TaxID=1123014 RepID=A0A1Y6BXF0_9NEIS|nr:thioredoxin family protein [Pseudogulbenkiania subflava]SMF23106.1 Thioredoxin domain-containing protein [Pseudogulbenkiania subflava DSM 22618]SMF32439.1 Thioredoxin domain-containing protein [Pseudogulbenkiania subflava DSM 22618]SMF47534.1 Thioredoxin domain-containing protein [Pseudogulbenkiania subflava DSM 22618]